MISIQIEHLTKRFGSVVALNDLSLRIEAGELFFLLGPSGGGKTTLLRNLAGFHLPEAGSIHFGDEDVTRWAPHRRNTGMMFQSYALWPHLSVAQNVAFGLEERKVPRGEITRRVGEALESVRMAGYDHRSPNELSGGQQQRVALARALVIRPRCLLLDEPLSNLDARLRLEMRVEIRRVCKEFKLTTVYVTHDQKEAFSVADRMAVLDQGRVLQVGSPREIYHRPGSRSVAELTGETNIIPGRLISNEGENYEVETALGVFQGRSGNVAVELVVGGNVSLSIRPECWRMSEASAGINVVAGQVGEAMYLGEATQYSFETGTQTLKILALNARHLPESTEGQWRIRVDPEDVIVLIE